MDSFDERAQRLCDTHKLTACEGQDRPCDQRDPRDPRACEFPACHEWMATRDAIAAEFRAIAAEQREKDARICDGGMGWQAEECAATIRAAKDDAP